MSYRKRALILLGLAALESALIAFVLTLFMGLKFSTGIGIFLMCWGVTSAILSILCGE